MTSTLIFRSRYNETFEEIKSKTGGEKCARESLKFKYEKKNYHELNHIIIIK